MIAGGACHAAAQRAQVLSISTVARAGVNPAARAARERASATPASLISAVAPQRQQMKCSMAWSGTGTARSAQAPTRIHAPRLDAQPCVHMCASAFLPAMERTAFLSVRLPPDLRNRVRAAAAARGQSVQDLVGGLVRDFLAAQDRLPPSLPAVLARLRAKEAALRPRGLAGLWVFGSVARGEARPDSDIDLIAEFDPAARVSLTSLASLRADLADLLGTPVDLAEWDILRPPVLDRARREAVRVF